jgi:hypothetical protein
MIHQKSKQLAAARALALVTSLATGILANAQGTAGQPALDSGRAEADGQSESQKPADAVAIHEGAGPVDCETLLAQENNTQPGTASRTDNADKTDVEPASNPHRENMPNEDTQISTIEECREQQNADRDQQPDSAVKK